MTRKLLSLALLLIFGTVGYAQDEEESPEYTAPAGESAENSDPAFKPVLGLGAGMFTFYGDYSGFGDHKWNHPLTSRVGFDLRVTQAILPWLDGSFYVLYGKLGANPTSVDLNFESTITIGGMNLAYNFGHFYKKTPTFQPYLSVGFESLEFLSKTDLVDAYGNTYYYWSNGGTYNIAEDAPNAGEAIRIQRDFVYESDVRESNVDGFGKYPERTWAIPIGFGGNLNLSPKVSFRIGTALHYTLTDYVDGVTAESIGERKGNSTNDMFMFTSFNLNYNLLSGIYNEVDIEGYDENGAEFVNLEEDSDQDGIIDLEDECPHNPLGIEVDEKGCPKDEDNDGVPNYKDLEPGTDRDAIVDSLGRAMTEDQLLQIYLSYIDSTGQFANITHVEHVGESGKRRSYGPVKPYMVTIGEFTGPVPQDFANYLLGIPDLQVIEKGDTTIFTVGDFETLPEAVQRKLNLIRYLPPGGLSDPTVYQAITDAKQDEFGYAVVPEGNQALSETAPGVVDPDQIVYRIQIGAYSRKLSADVFKDVPSVVGVSSEDGLTRYMSGSYTNFKDAAAAKVDLVLKGFPGAFVVPFKNGQRIRLAETNEATVVEDFKKNPDSGSTSPSVDKELVRFRVQVGAYKENIPTAVLDQLMSLGNVESRQGTGVKKYVVGNFATYEEAQAFREQVAANGIDGAFVVGEFDGKIISSKEAQELLK